MESGDRKRRDQATPYDAAAWSALRASLAEARGLPPAWRELLLDEAAALIDASRRHLAATAPSGILTRRGPIKAAYADLLALQPRLERVLKLLGLDGGDSPSQPLSPTERAAEIRRQIAEGRA